MEFVARIITTRAGKPKILRVLDNLLQNNRFEGKWISECIFKIKTPDIQEYTFNFFSDDFDMRGIEISYEGKYAIFIKSIKPFILFNIIPTDKFPEGWTVTVKFSEGINDENPLLLHLKLMYIKYP